MKIMKSPSKEKIMKKIIFAIFEDYDYLNCRCKPHKEMRERLLKVIEGIL